MQSLSASESTTWIDMQRTRTLHRQYRISLLSRSLYLLRYKRTISGTRLLRVDRGTVSQRLRTDGNG